jgi:hypothetical protein
VPPCVAVGELEDLLKEARSAPPNDRIAFRDPIAAHGSAAISALIPWLSDKSVASFAVLTIGAISEAEVLEGRPMLSSIVKQKGGGIHLGVGFANLAEQLGLKPVGSDPDEFARAEAQRTFDYWRTH